MKPIRIDIARILQFLGELIANNDRGWFQSHKSEYDAAKVEFESLVGFAISELNLGDSNLKPSDCIHRIYRDVRFSKDKSPYKSAMSAMIAPGGKKSPRLGVYIHLEPHGQSVVAGGLYAPEPAILKKFRKDMEDGPRAFKAILASRDFIQHLTLMDSEKLKRIPAGIDPDHPALELILMKNIVAIHRFSDNEVLAENGVEQIIAAGKALRPFLDYLEEAVGIRGE